MVGHNCEPFQCLKGRVLLGEVSEKKHSFRRAKKRLNPDLSVRDKRLKTTVEMARMLQKPELDLPRSALGSVCTLAAVKVVTLMK